MPTPDTIERFISRVESNLHAEAVEEFYTADACIQENQSLPRIGRNPQAARERVMLARTVSATSQCVRPVFVNGNNVVIRWIFHFEWADGSFTHMEELAYQRWEGERIAQETFFYDPAQAVPQKR
ncbi:nuclear transport factor 2 family protein [Undibacterium sp. Di26W]|uniref:nuclear transport factor 2 family protein n=1 Tax=Undibacterium sp. Di26W TaxID=3413035 RepID=UPI003BF2F27F